MRPFQCVPYPLLPSRPSPCKSVPIIVDLSAEFIRLSKTNERRFRTWRSEECGSDGKWEKVSYNSVVCSVIVKIYVC